MVCLSLVLAGLLSPPPQDPHVEILHAERPPYNTLPGLPGRSIHDITRVVASRGGQYAITGKLEGPHRPHYVAWNRRAVLADDMVAPWATQHMINVHPEIAFDTSGALHVTARESGGRHVLVAGDASGSWKVRAGTGWQLGRYPAISYLETRELYQSANGPVGGLILLDGAGQDKDQVLYSGAGVVVQKGVDGPVGVQGHPNAVWTNLFYGGVFTSPDLAHTMVVGSIDGETSCCTRVLALDGQAIAKEGQPLYGGPFSEPIDDFLSYGFTLDGSWYLCGKNKGSEDVWMLVDGQVVLQSGDPILPGAPRVWAQGSLGLMSVAADAGREFVAGRAVDSMGVEGSVLVESGVGVVLEEGDPVDWDGDGVANDGYEFFRVYRALSFDRAGRLVMLAELRDTQVGRGFYAALRVTLAGPRLDPGPLLAGQAAQLDLTGAEPGASASLTWSSKIGSGRFVGTPFGRLHLDVGEPAGTADAVLVDAAGTAQWTLSVPAAAAGRSYVAQVLVVGSSEARLTPPRVETVQ